MAMYKFILQGNREGKTQTILDRYHFVDGEMIVNGKDAKKMRPILVDYFACKMEKVESTDESQTEGSEDQGSSDIDDED